MARTVLVADDSPTHQRRASGILTGEGLEVVTVSNGVAAIKKLSTLKPVLILADVSMPGRDGYEVCEFVKSSPDLARVPVLLIFSDLEPFDEGRAQRSRADGRIKKPFGEDELVATINRFLPEEEAAPPPPPAPAVQAAPPEPALVTEPVDEEPQVAPKEEVPELSLSEGMAFGESALQEEAAPGFAPPPVVEQPAVPEPPAESGFGFAPPAEEAPSPEVSAPPEAEAPAEEAPPSEPILEEEAAAVPPPEPAPAERTMMFRTPVQIAEPILSDELAPPPAAEPETAPEPEIPPAEVTLAGAASLESYSLDEAGSGQVRFAEAEGEAEAPPPEAAEAPPTEAPSEQIPPAEAAAPAPEEAVVPTEAAVQVVDTDLVYWIVHSVIVRMAPPALPTPMVEEMIRSITDEIIGELTQPPPQS